MSSHVVVLVASSAIGLLAVVLLTTTPSPESRRPDAPIGDLARQLVAGMVGGATVLAVTGWVAPSLVAAIAAARAIRGWQRRDRRATDELARTEALASWIESLRDVLVAGDQPIGAITATVSTCPAPIRPQVRRLAAGLGRQSPDDVLRRFADEIDDPLGDLVAAGLSIAIVRGARTVDVLSSLASQARQQADRRRLVEAERAPVQREVAVLTVVMGALVAGLLLFGRAAYLAPYDTSGGQLFLGGVLVVYALLLSRVRRLATYPRPSRFLVAGTGP